MGTAANVLRFLGPETQLFIARPEVFIYGWVDDDQTDQGRVLLLQVIPREPPPRDRPSLN